MKRLRDKARDRQAQQQRPARVKVRLRAALRRARREGVGRVPPRYAPRARPLLWLQFEGRLDLVSEPDATRKQLAQFDQVRIPGLRESAAAPEAAPTVMVDLRGVESIDPISLLYLVAQIERLSEGRRLNIQGTYPVLDSARQIFADAGFERYMRGELGHGVSREPILQICSGRTNQLFNPDQWTRLHTFLESQGGLGVDAAEITYQAFSECIENVMQHAFPDRNRGTWHALAIRPSASAPARAVVVDLGIGIPRSVRLTATEMGSIWLTKWLGAMLGPKFRQALALGDADDAGGVVDTNDAACLWLATQGLRTETEEKKRGTGLSGLLAAAEETKGALHVLSGRAAVTWRDGVLNVSPGELPLLRGTVVCLEFPEVPST